jgi:hypothetical protein
MTAQTNPSMPESASLPSAGPRLIAGISVLKARFKAWLQTCADYYEAAALFDQLSRLSDAELSRRGLSRATLSRDVCEACDSTAPR